MVYTHKTLTFLASASLIAACGSDTTSQTQDVSSDTGSDTTLACTPTCDDEGARSCDGASVLTCNDGNDDGCLEWVELLACGAGTTCVDGTCGVACPDAPCNAAGARKCEGTSIATCGDSDTDGCLDWGAVEACNDGLVCANGFCALSCSDTCTAVGARKCEANAVVTCGDHNEDGCLEWGQATECTSGETCSAGFCATTCSDECANAGATRCDTGGVSTCGQFDADDCREWGTVVACAPEETCSNGSCATTCTSECSTLGARACDGNRTKVCEDPDEDGCYTWSSPVPCDAGLACASGQCTTTCTNDCTVVGAKSCDLGGRVITCGDFDTDSCLEWGEGVNCGASLVCAGGNCAVSCTSTCAAVGIRQCSAGSTGAYEICDDHNDDGCLEWGTPTECGGSLVCAAGQCEATCSNTCGVVGARVCDGNAIRTCGDYNADSCIELGTAEPCDLTESCQNGVCEALTPSATIIINEIVINSPGNPDLDTFVELYGPAGTDLTGYTLVGVNGNGGDDYGIIQLSGTIASDGLFVVTHPDAKPAIADMSDLEAIGVDYQNGPDSIQVRFGATVLDALAYGSFGVNDTFAGEGSAAPAMGSDEALARDANHTDTNDNAADFTLSTATPGVGNADANVAPVARVTCPTGVTAGASRVVDGSGSTDADGAITSWRFNFGDGTPALTGSETTVTHTWTTAGNYVVTLTVSDDGGLTHAATCQVAVTDGNGPTVTLIKPANQLQVTQGDTIAILADATPAAGRSIAEMTFWAGSTQIGTDDTVPYEATWTVPANAVTGSTVAIEARARDSSGAIGVSSARILRIENDAPVAAFTATVTGALQVTADASASYDTETAPAALEVRWDWDNDGAWDTQWSTTRRVTYTYPATGTKTIRLEVRDAIGQTTTSTRSVDLALVQTVSGSVTTTTWSGTVVVTGDVVVAAGQTLTIASGTSVLFAAVDQGSDGVGDYDILVNGALKVEGTDAAPVVFTTYGTQAKAPRDWNGLILKGAGSTISHAIIEYANIGLSIENNAQVADVEIRSCFNGLRFGSNGNGSRVDRAYIHANTDHGVVGADSHIGTLAESTVARNGGHGLRIGGTAQISLLDSVVRDNGKAGLEYVDSARGSVMRNIVTANAYEGLRIATVSGTGPVVQINNIFGNATVGARIVVDVNLQVATTPAYYLGSSQSASWSPPGAAVIDLVRFEYAETDSTSNLVKGAVVGATTATNYFTTNSPTERWVDLTGFPAARTVRVVVDDTSGSYFGSAAISRVAYTSPGAVAEVSVVAGVSVDLRFNHWGTYESPLPVASLGVSNTANLQGFRGVAYDATWIRAPWVGGDTLTEDTTWSGDIYVTGTVQTTAAATLTVTQGTTVRFAPVDQNGDGFGDYSLQTVGPLVVDGASGARVTFTSMSPTPAAGHWYRIYATGATSIRHSEIAFGLDGLTVNAASSAHALADIETHDHLRAGMRLVTVRTGTADRITSHSNGTNGLELTTSGSASFAFDRLVIRDNALHGFTATNVSGTVTASNSRFTNNGGIGLALDRANVAVSYTEISFNREGARYFGSSAGALTASDIKFNDREGLVFLSSLGASPTPSVTGNNIFGNSVEESSVLATVTVGVTTTASYYLGTQSSALWRAPDNALIHAFQANYTESDSTSNLVKGSVSDQDGNVLTSASAPVLPRFYAGWAPNVTGIRAHVSDTSGSYYGSMSVTQVLHEGGTATIELAAMVDSGAVTVTGNYWGTFPEVQARMTLSRSDAVNFQGFQISQISGTGPQ